jgi:hypothetical protein
MSPRALASARWLGSVRFDLGPLRRLQADYAGRPIVEMASTQSSCLTPTMAACRRSQLKITATPGKIEPPLTSRPRPRPRPRPGSGAFRGVGLGRSGGRTHPHPGLMPPMWRWERWMLPTPHWGHIPKPTHPKRASATDPTLRVPFLPSAWAKPQPQASRGTPNGIRPRKPAKLGAIRIPPNPAGSRTGPP